MQEVLEKMIEKLLEKRCEAEKNMELSDVLSDANTYGGMFVGYDKAIEIVKQEAEHYNNGWIPYIEPPETGVYVLLSFSNFSVPTVGRYEEDEKGGAYYIGDEEETCIQQDMFVNAWQPLPAPYDPHICTNNDCVFNERKDCPAAEGCGGYERKRTNFDMCCESMEAMAQIIDIAKAGWTKEQIIEWLKKEECEIPE